ncbi:hypothetical protein K440DRAFT_646628 [Wilcoxina mikolae CBS 423.85]|nr:hypothetical protein K440DRAFT_646628 [Wilcoxina mikolae CBS 423.85]
MMIWDNGIDTVWQKNIWLSGLGHRFLNEAGEGFHFIHASPLGAIFDKVAEVLSDSGTVRHNPTNTQLHDISNGVKIGFVGPTLPLMFVANRDAFSEITTFFIGKLHVYDFSGQLFKLFVCRDIKHASNIIPANHGRSIRSKFGKYSWVDFPVGGEYSRQQDPNDPPAVVEWRSWTLQHLRQGKKWTTGTYTTWQSECAYA